MKYVVVTGGVLSGLGKGVTASSIGVLLKACGPRVTSIKIDPYLHLDAGTISPSKHGEVFVLDDGGEVDLDLGNYERFLDIQLTRNNNITTGKIVMSVLDKERKGEYLGETVQIANHVTKAIQEWIRREEGPPDVCIIELGGIVGDIESMIFTEALSQFFDNLVVHVSFFPVFSVIISIPSSCLTHIGIFLIQYPHFVLLQKTKPTQHSVRALRGFGLTPDALVCRSFNV
ncbi:hypothetical protein SETIT_3G126300v2 [Setaria italica]|uniref:CTP synthase N-terminal domain-containing protein n=2 Tax=Setaria TaxID=4554 RepID=A0A368QEP5_SETIT|nr:hypothetical protein SETIT_3G126300v2 [Setaria italica]TKW25588.1 hypothetical protein SEVIR_3G128800v2 [Setaria viridis]